MRQAVRLRVLPSSRAMTNDLPSNLALIFNISSAWLTRWRFNSLQTIAGSATARSAVRGATCEPMYASHRGTRGDRRPWEGAPLFAGGEPYMGNGQNRFNLKLVAYQVIALKSKPAKAARKSRDTAPAGGESKFAEASDIRGDRVDYSPVGRSCRRTASRRGLRGLSDPIASSA